MQQFLGIHHVTAITDSAERNYQFITEILGMRLVKKTVNQDDIQTYHTFFADDQGNAGTDVTFFDFPNIQAGVNGSNSISRIGLRVPSDKALEYYQARFEKFGVEHQPITEVMGMKVLPFQEADGQRYQLFSDEGQAGVAAGIPWQNGPIPVEYAIYGLGPIEITVSYYDDFKNALSEIYGMRIVEEKDHVTLFEMGEGGNGARVILKGDTETAAAQEGYGQVHHVSFRVPDEQTLQAWSTRYTQLNIRNSGIIDRFYFKALYARIGHILIEISTDGPGFMTDEPYETLGEKLSLPPFLEEERAAIEAMVRPFDTVWKHKKD